MEIGADSSSTLVQSAAGTALLGLTEPVRASHSVIGALDNTSMHVTSATPLTAPIDGAAPAMEMPAVDAMPENGTDTHINRRRQLLTLLQ